MATICCVSFLLFNLLNPPPPPDSALRCIGSIQPVNKLRFIVSTFVIILPLFLAIHWPRFVFFFFTLLHFPTPPHLLHPSTPAQLAKRRMSRQGVRLSCLSHAICGVTLRHSVTFSTVRFPSSRDSEPKGIDGGVDEGLDPEGEIV